MRRIHLFVAAVLVATLAVGVGAPAAASAEWYPAELVCSGETVTYEIPLHSWSWTLHEPDGTSRLVVHRWTLYAPAEDGGTQVLVDRARGNPRLEQCWTTCPMGYPIEVWGIRTR